MPLHQLRREPANHRFYDSLLPQGLVEFVDNICRERGLTQQVLMRATYVVERAFARHASVAQLQWEEFWRPSNRVQAMQLLGQLRDEAMRQRGRDVMTEGMRVEVLPHRLVPQNLLFPRALSIEDGPTTSLTLGAARYLEQTPVDLLRWVHAIWLHSQSKDGDVGIEQPRPVVWDLTAGSGTGRDYFGDVHQCKVDSFDLVVADSRTTSWDVRGQFLPVAKRAYNDLPFERPDLIFFDPPTRGLPLHSQLYGPELHVADIGLLDRAQWIREVAEIAIRATRHMTEGGFLSLLVRCGFRFHSEVGHDLEVLDGVKVALRGRATIIHEMPVIFRQRCNQTSIGRARAPAVHFLLQPSEGARKHGQSRSPSGVANAAATAAKGSST